MPVYMEISRLHRTVSIVARGKITPDEARGVAQQLADAHVRPFAKIVDVASAVANGDLAPEQIARMAALLRGDGREMRGPVAFIVDPDRGAFARAFAAEIGNEGPVNLFKSLHEARAWLERIQHGPADEAMAARAAQRGQSAWSDPQRRGVLLRGGRQRPFTARLLVGA